MAGGAGGRGGGGTGGEVKRGLGELNLGVGLGIGGDGTNSGNGGAVTVQWDYTGARGETTYQLVRSDSLFNKRMMDTVRGALDGRDLLLYLADASLAFTEADAQAIDLVRKVGLPCVLALNKIDTLPKPRILPALEAWSRFGKFEDIVPISALKGENVDRLLEVLSAHMPEAEEPIFPPDMLTDQAERQIAAEYVREHKLSIETARAEYGLNGAGVVDQPWPLQ